MTELMSPWAMVTSSTGYKPSPSVSNSNSNITPSILSSSIPRSSPPINELVSRYSAQYRTPSSSSSTSAPSASYTSYIITPPASCEGVVLKRSDVGIALASGIVIAMVLYIRRPKYVRVHKPGTHQSPSEEEINHSRIATIGLLSAGITLLVPIAIRMLRSPSSN